MVPIQIQMEIKKAYCLVVISFLLCFNSVTQAKGTNNGIEFCNLLRIIEIDSVVLKKNWNEYNLMNLPLTNELLEVLSIEEYKNFKKVRRDSGVYHLDILSIELIDSRCFLIKDTLDTLNSKLPNFSASNIYCLNLERELYVFSYKLYTGPLSSSGYTVLLEYKNKEFKLLYVYNNWRS